VFCTKTNLQLFAAKLNPNTLKPFLTVALEFYGGIMKLTALHWVLLIAFAFMLGACDTSTPTPPAPKITRLEITPGGLLLTKAGESQVLSVKAFDAENHEVPTSVTWTSSNPANATVDSSGRVTAASDLGSAQIVAQVDALKSAPALVTMAQPAAGVILLTDAQIQTEPTLVDPNAEADIENPYEVLITGINPPAPGALLLGREGKAVGGEVISSTVEGNAVRVRLVIPPLDRLLQNTQIKQVLDYSNIPMNFSPELLENYTVTQTDGEYVFTPKASSKLSPRELFERPFGPFKCELGVPELPIALAQPATFRMKIDPSLDLEYDKSKGGLQKLIVRASTSFKMSANLTLSASGLVNVTCEATLFNKTMPAPGVAGLLLAAQVKAGVGFELEGSLTIPLLGAELTSETKGDLEVGLDCTAGECQLVKKFDPVNTNQIRFITPNVANVRTELFIFGYGFVKLKGGMTLIEKLRTDVVTVRGGAKLESSLAPATVQVETNNSTLEPDYKSSYKMSLLADVIVGPINKKDKSAINKLLFKLGVFRLNYFKFQTSKPLAISPKGTASLDKASFKTGDALTFHVDLDPETVQFWGKGYNIDNILILQHTPGSLSLAREIAKVKATDGQISFDLPWVADANSDSASGQNFYAFVNTKIPSIFDLELAKVGLPTAEATPNADAGSFYTVTPVPFLVAYGFNDSGQVLGVNYINNSTAQYGIWDKSTGITTDLSATIPGLKLLREYEVPVDTKYPFNNAGHFIAKIETTGQYVFVKGTTVVSLPPDFGPFSLNNNDQIGGYFRIYDSASNTESYAPAIWQSGSVTQIHLPINSINPFVINDSGHIASSLYANCNDDQGFIQSDSLFVFKFPDRSLDCAEIQLEIGFVTTLTNNDSLIFRHRGWGYLMRDHQFVVRGPTEYFQDINEANDVIGYDTKLGGFLWTKGERSASVLLKSDSQGWNAFPFAINNNKQILARKAIFNNDYFLLTPKVPSADLEISMIAPATATPDGNITYAVNLHNKSETSASNVRVEFSLPQDFTIIDNVGWSGCTTIQTTVTCKLETLAANERRAFLVNVKAPADAGFYVMQTRVGANETDPDFSNNSDVGITVIQ
jgi:uncharacterized repeat protein (TIGR01451 family)